MDILNKKYTKSQIAAAAKRNDVHFEEMLRSLFDEADDVAFYRYVDALLTKIYILKLENKYLTKTQACRMIPARNASTCIKYVNEAEKRNFITFVHDAADKRRLMIHPSDALIDYVEAKISGAIDEMRDIIWEIANEGVPEDNRPLSGLKT